MTKIGSSLFVPLPFFDDSLSRVKFYNQNGSLVSTVTVPTFKVTSFLHTDDNEGEDFDDNGNEEDDDVVYENVLPLLI